LNYCTSSLSSTLSVWCGRNLRVHLSTACPRYNDTRPTKLETDTSDFALEGVLSQLCEDEKRHPVAFHSRKFSPAEINYDVHDKEMAGVVAAFKEWAYILMSVNDRILVYTDHKNLEYFNTTKTLNRRQHRWAEFLQPFNFKVIYREGRLNQKADALSRRSEYALKGGVIPNLLHVFALDSILERSLSSCDHMCCRLAKVSGCRQHFIRLL